MIKKGFVISWFYPPGNSSEGLVTYKLLSHSKYQYDVWTRETQSYDIWDRQTNETKLCSDNVNVIQAKYENSKQWIADAIRFFTEHSNEYSFVMSRTMPAEAHEIALAIKKIRPDIPWLASFGDPFVNTPYIAPPARKDNPYLIQRYIEEEELSLLAIPHVGLSITRNAQKFVWNKERNRTKVFAKKYRKINDEVFESADVLVFNNDFQFKHAFQEEYTKYQSKGIVIPHSFAEELYPKMSQKKDSKSKIRFVYAGHLDSLRNASSLFKAIKILKGQDAKLSSKVVFDFYGHMSDEDKVSIVDYDIADIVKVHPDINYLTSLKVFSEADWTLLIDANFVESMEEYIFFPAKLADYLGAKRNIFAISQVKGAAASILQQVGGGKVVTHSAEDIFLYLSKIIYQGFAPKPFNAKELAKYESSNVAEKYDELVAKLIEKGNRR